jgi:hypothetical protein
MDGKRGKPLVLITGPRPRGIKRVKHVTNNKHDKLTSGSRSIELTLGVYRWDFIIIIFIFIILEMGTAMLGITTSHDPP